jgi:vacuolar-type H+-ATPase subunit H
MSFRNGDKSRENRIRKARQKRREKVRQFETKKASSEQSHAVSKD